MKAFCTSLAFQVMARLGHSNLTDHRCRSLMLRNVHSIAMCYAGEENLDFVESLRKSKIKLITTRHEQAAGFMAATVGRLTGMHLATRLLRM